MNHPNPVLLLRGNYYSEFCFFLSLAFLYSFNHVFIVILKFDYKAFSWRSHESN